MQSRLSPLALIIALLLAFGVIAVACDGSSGGGGEPLTLDEYFQRLEALSVEAVERSEALGEDIAEETSSTLSEEERLEVIRKFLDATLPITEDFVDRIRDLNPPTEIEDEHNRALEAHADVLSVLTEYLNEHPEVESESELQALFTNPAFERFVAACLALQEIADENSIDVDLDCEDGEEL